MDCVLSSICGDGDGDDEVFGDDSGGGSGDGNGGVCNGGVNIRELNGSGCYH